MAERTYFRPGVSNRTASDVAQSFWNGGRARIASRNPIANIAGGVGGLFSNFLFGGIRQNSFDRHANEIANSQEDWSRRAGDSLMNSAGADALNRMQGRGFDQSWFHSEGLPGITSPRGNDGGFQPIDLDYGQQVADENTNGFPGITSANPYARPLMSAPAQTNLVANMSGGGARDAFAGGGQSSARGGSSNWGNTFQSLGDLGTQGGGLDPQRNQNVGEQRLRQRARAMLEKDPNDARAKDWFARMRENATAGK